MNKILIELQQSCVQQLTHATNGKLDWEVYNNEGQVLFVLPKELNEKEIFKIQDYAKEFELKAFNIGMNEMKRQKDIDIENMKIKFQNQLNQLRVENERLADALGNAIGASDIEGEEAKIGIPEHMR